MRDWNFYDRKQMVKEMKGSNQTVAGLKRSGQCDTQVYIKCSNQTVAGLKLDIFEVKICEVDSFKSDRCGIETRWYWWTLQWSNLFKSDRCGIETSSAAFKAYRQAWFKSDRCGIETKYFRKEPEDIYLSSNQTVAGLKLHYDVVVIQHRRRSNQTVAGLKRTSWSASFRWLWSSNQTVAGLKLRREPPMVIQFQEFKSDRCGIET